ncbi:MAG: response regulator [Cyanobacteria bacterium J06621_8]
MIRTIIIDDENLIRQTLQIYFESEQNIEIVGTGDNGHSAIALAETLKPDVVLIDIEMPEMDGLTAAESLLQRFPQIKVIILSSYDEPTYINRALAAGATGYLLKNLSPQELSQSIQLVYQGYLQIAPGLSDKLLLACSYLERLSSTAVVTVESPQTEHLDSGGLQLKRPVEIGYCYSSSPQKIESRPKVEPEESLTSVGTRTTRGAAILLGIFSTALIIANGLQYKTTVKGLAKISPEGELRTVQTAVPGKITQIKVEANQDVRQGDIIATVDDAALRTQLSQIKENLWANQAQLGQTEAQIVELNQQIVAETNALTRMIAARETDLIFNQQSYRQLNSTVEAELAAANAQLQLATEELSRYQQLAATGAVSQLKISEKQAALQESIARQRQAQSAIMPTNPRGFIAEEQIAREQAQSRAKISSLNLESQQLREKQISLEKDIQSDRTQIKQLEQDLEQTTIRATTSGMIQQLNLRNVGQIIQAEEEIATIVPDYSSLIVSAQIAPQDIGKIEVNQEVQIKVDTCHHSDYGVLAGVVKSIAPNALVDESQNLYQVKIKPNQNVFSNSEQQCAIAPGMKGEVSIITKKESVMSFLLRKARLILNPV